jgi:hypothetical protein
MSTFLVGLLISAALVAAPSVASSVHQLQIPAASAATDPATVITTRTVRGAAAPVVRQAAPPATPGPRDVAVTIVERYESALVAGDWSVAFDLLAATSLTHEAGFGTFAAERAAFFESVDGRYVIADPTRVTSWTGYGPTVNGAFRPRAWLTEVAYPALTGNNAGYEQFVVAPDASGAWKNLARSMTGS